MSRRSRFDEDGGLESLANMNHNRRGNNNNNGQRHNVAPNVTNTRMAAAVRNNGISPFLRQQQQQQQTNSSFGHEDAGQEDAYGTYDEENSGDEGYGGMISSSNNVPSSSFPCQLKKLLSSDDAIRFADGLQIDDGTAKHVSGAPLGKTRKHHKHSSSRTSNSSNNSQRTYVANAIRH